MTTKCWRLWLSALHDQFHYIFGLRDIRGVFALRFNGAQSSRKKKHTAQQWRAKVYVDQRMCEFEPYPIPVLFAVCTQRPCSTHIRLRGEPVELMYSNSWETSVLLVFITYCWCFVRGPDATESQMEEACNTSIWLTCGPRADGSRRETATLGRVSCAHLPSIAERVED